MASRLFQSFFPSVKAQEEDIIDPQTVLREKCAQEGHATHLYEKYQACNDRVNSRSQTTETCVEELFDYMHELDHCVNKTLFSKLK
ncbi:cytochrome b-c1 complex subunit 6, mitochondrial [Toxorhynchites rutilus septentrionalis]|uniref:cytochrome b-c1 complex subunit 6, mitochondrial n=1 Tax=Toxorhynchites rutilus septentrionalis TaxID=329112 RepID=UPI002479BE37|nr:cytochrome b-c1 complex subunit 6, mitochondrial [Toxorhynchites rutilus septentrionalis]XP_055641064.1 cytochrome b-c1 complex subunit 6, mitochondrial [Toxorhynchites rutilus septentrionalis]